MQPKWTCEDSRAAMTEGWDLFEAHGNDVLWDIERDDEAAAFASDADAMAHVAARAATGSDLHQRALALHGSEPPPAASVRPMTHHHLTITDHELGLILGALSVMEDIQSDGMGEDGDREAAECMALRMKLPAWKGD
jgi:hypothetical protein